MLNIKDLKTELKINTENLVKALNENNIEKVYNLQNQRANIKDMLLAAYETELLHARAS